jgi:hypothetical protein
MNLRNKTKNKAGLNNKEISSDIDDKRGNEEKAGIMLDDEALEKVAGGSDFNGPGKEIVTPLVRPY